eukprot:g2831.t1
MRGKWPKLQANHLVICAGPERSGSTWLYNAVRLLHLKAQVPCDSYWMTRLSHAKLEERLRAQPLAVVLVKTHEWSADYAELVPMAKHIFLTHRDLRGVVASYRHNVQDMAVDAYSGLRTPTFRSTWSGDAIVRWISAMSLGSQLSSVQSDLIQLKRSHCGNAVCQVTKLWPDHRSAETERLQGKGCAANNAELNELKDEAYAQVLNTRFKEYQMLYGYLND